MFDCGEGFTMKIERFKEATKTPKKKKIERNEHQ